MASDTARRTWTGLKLFLLVGPLFGATLAGIFFWKHPLPLEVPPLLKDVGAAAADAEACSPTNEREGSDDAMPPHPTLDSRLRETFPAGTSEDRVIGVLVGQGFRLFEACPNEPSIHAANFRKDGGVFSYIVTANAIWKVDAARNVVWTKGYLSYSRYTDLK